MERTERAAADYVADVARSLGFGVRRPCVEDFVDAAMGPRGMALATLPVARSALARVGSDWTIFVDQRLSPAQMRWRLAHHFADWLLREDGVGADGAAALRSPVAAELLISHDVAARMVGRVPFLDLARKLVVPAAAMLLREAEVARVPTALLATGQRGRYARVRGDDAARLPTDVAALELLASRRGIGILRFAVPEDGGVIVRVAA
jgi:hypothetical protein